MVIRFVRDCNDFIIFITVVVIAKLAVIVCVCLRAIRPDIVICIRSRHFSPEWWGLIALNCRRSIIILFLHFLHSARNIIDGGILGALNWHFFAVNYSAISFYLLVVIRIEDKLFGALFIYFWSGQVIVICGGCKISDLLRWFLRISNNLLDSSRRDVYLAIVRLVMESMVVEGLRGIIAGRSDSLWVIGWRSGCLNVVIWGRLLHAARCNCLRSSVIATDVTICIVIVKCVVRYYVLTRWRSRWDGKIRPKSQPIFFLVFLSVHYLFWGSHFLPDYSTRGLIALSWSPINSSIGGAIYSGWGNTSRDCNRWAGINPRRGWWDVFRNTTVILIVGGDIIVRSGIDVGIWYGWIGFRVLYGLIAVDVMRFRLVGKDRSFVHYFLYADFFKWFVKIWWLIGFRLLWLKVHDGFFIWATVLITHLVNNHWRISIFRLDVTGLFCCELILDTYSHGVITRMRVIYTLNFRIEIVAWTLIRLDLRCLFPIDLLYRFFRYSFPLFVRVELIVLYDKLVLMFGNHYVNIDAAVTCIVIRMFEL